MATYLADTSAWHWSGRVGDHWSDLLESDELTVCTPVALELLSSARGHSDYRNLARDLQGLVWVASDAETDTLARQTQAALAARSRHRGATPIDIQVAAHAARNDLVLLHYDRHFDLIARTTGQAAEWLARRGSLE